MLDASLEPNAWVEPDGTIVLTEGMLRLCEDNDELAAVVAHEMAHRLANHKGRQSPAKEIEADRLSISLMSQAGYDVAAAVRFWTRYYSFTGYYAGDGTHPPPHERLAMLERLCAASSERRGAQRSAE